MGQQQQVPPPSPDGQQYQQQQQQLLPPNSGGAPPKQTASSVPVSTAQQAAGNVNPTPWVSYRAPSPRHLAGPTTFSQPRVSNGNGGVAGGGGGGGDRAQYPPSSYYAQGPGGSETAKYSSAPANPIAGGSVSGGGAWRGSSSGVRQESFPPVAAFASGGGSGGGGAGSGAGAGMNGVAPGGGGGGVTGMAQRSPDPAHSSSDVRVPHQSYLQRHQQQSRGSPIDGTPQQQQQQQKQSYWDRSLPGRGWPTAGSEVGPLHPPGRSASSEFTRAPTSSAPLLARAP